MFNLCINKLVYQHITDIGTVERTYESGRIERIYSNSVKVDTYPDGYVITYYTNGNIKQVFPKGKKTVEYYKDLKLTQTKFKSGLEIKHYENGHLEK